MTHPLTDEQISILGLAHTTTSNLMINSYAGTGKTFTLEQIERGAKQNPILYLVFNRRNADEAKDRMLGSTAVRTFNSLGHRVWASTITPSLKLETKKTYNLFKEIADEVKGEAAREIWASWEQVKFGVDIAKALGYVPERLHSNAQSLISKRALHNHFDEEPDDLTSDLVDTILGRGIKLSYDGIIDYNDQIYMPSLFGGAFPRFPLTLVDEYQDLNPINHHMIEKLVGKRRIIGVGDPNQNIYGFRGAKINGMEDAADFYSMSPAELSVSFRCPEAIVANVRWHVPNFKSSRPGGHVEILTSLDPNSLRDDATFLCRLNAPLFSLAMRLLSIGRGVRIVGSDIGPRLLSIMRKLGNESLDRQGMLDAIDEWLEFKLARDSKTAEDTAACMRVFARQGSNLGQAIAYADHLFKQHGSIQLLTGHKSKGLEFPLVYHLDPHLIGEGRQDKNIRYVIGTRSSNEYYEIRSDEIQW